MSEWSPKQKSDFLSRKNGPSHWAYNQQFISQFLMLNYVVDSFFQILRLYTKSVGIFLLIAVGKHVITSCKMSL